MNLQDDVAGRPIPGVGTTNEFEVLFGTDVGSAHEGRYRYTFELFQ